MLAQLNHRPIGRNDPDDGALLELILEGISEGVLVVDARGSLVKANAAFERTMDLSDGWQEPGRLHDIVASIDAQLDMHGTGASYVSALPNGRFVALSARAVGGLKLYTTRDVTQERCSRSRIAKSERLLRETLDSVDASIVVYDRDDRFVLGNKTYFSMYPHLPDDGSLAGKTFEEMIRLTIAAGANTSQLSIEDPEEFVRQRLAEKRVNIEREQLHPRGRWDLLRSKRTPSGNVVTLRVDITEHKRLQQALAEARDEVVEASRAKSWFLAAMSHELRTPLNAIIGFSDLLASEIFGPIGSERYRGYAADIKEAGHHLLSLIGDILDLSKIEAGRMELQESEFTLEPVLQRELSMMRAEARVGANKLEMITQPGLALKGDQRMLGQMLLNLLSNALKFTRDGVIKVTAARGASGGIDISVEDTGIGMPASVVEKLGQPFYQAPRPQITSTVGTGLGLTIVKKMMALHDGNMIVTSREGVGTTVTLSFPESRSAFSGQASSIG